MTRLTCAIGKKWFFFNTAEAVSVHSVHVVGYFQPDWQHQAGPLLINYTQCMVPYWLIMNPKKGHSNSNNTAEKNQFFFW